MTEMYFCQLRTGISEESIWKLRSLPCAIWFLWNLSRNFNGMPHCSIIPLIRARENGSAMACVNLWLKTLRLSLSLHHPSLALHSSFTSSLFPPRCLLSFIWFSLVQVTHPSHSSPPFLLFLSCFVSHSNTLACMRCPFSSQAAACASWSIVCAFRRAHLNTFLSRPKRFRFLLSFLIKRDKTGLH